MVLERMRLFDEYSDNTNSRKRLVPRAQVEEFAVETVRNTFSTTAVLRRCSL